MLIFFYSLFQSCSYDFQNSNLFKAVFLWSQWDPKKEFDAKNRPKILDHCPFKEVKTTADPTLSPPLLFLFPSPSLSHFPFPSSLPSSSLSSSTLSSPLSLPLCLFPSDSHLCLFLSVSSPLSLLLLLSSVSLTLCLFPLCLFPLPLVCFSSYASPLCLFPFVYLPSPLPFLFPSSPSPLLLLSPLLHVPSVPLISLSPLSLASVFPPCIAPPPFTLLKLVPEISGSGQFPRPLSGTKTIRSK
jgi:hypothetical protein